MLAWMKSYIGLFLIFTMILYLLPSQDYRRYLRFFLEMVLVLFCITSLLTAGGKEKEKRWDQGFAHFYQEWEKRKQEAETMSFVDQAYLDVVLQGEDRNGRE